MRVDLVFRWVREHGLAIVGSVLRFVFFLTAVTRREYFFRLVSCGPCGVSSSPSELYPESYMILKTMVTRMGLAAMSYMRGEQLVSVQPYPQLRDVLSPSYIAARRPPVRGQEISSAAPRRRPSTKSSVRLRRPCSIH
jgi:hypothetical protein